LWWLLLSKINDSRWERFSIEAHDLISCCFKIVWDSTSSVSWRERRSSATECFASLSFFLRLNTFACSWAIVSFWVSIAVWLTSSSFNLLICSTCRLIYCLFSFKVMFCWSFSSINILIILFNWSWAHWRSCWLVLMFHEVVTFWNSAETSKEIMKTCLLAMLLSRWAVRDSTDSKSRVIVRKIDR